MGGLNICCIIITVIAVIFSFVTILKYRRKTKQILMNMDTMLDDAINGSFTESTFDESMLSALESKMVKYLSICAVSNKNLQTEKDKIKSLISDISHQTKTPIANIVLYSQLLSEYKLPQDCKICVEALSLQAEKLNFLIGALVKISRLETGIISVIPKQASIQELLDKVINQIKVKAEARGINIEFQKTEDAALFDMKWMVEAIYNIVDNGVKYSPPNSMIKISVKPYELFYCIDIKDHGIGISEEERSKIFKRFYRSKAVSDYEGVGIGLFLSREIISTQNGYIKVNSSIGQGSTFSVFIPKTS